MKRVFHRRTGAATSARIKDGASPSPGPPAVERAGSGSSGRQQAAAPPSEDRTTADGVLEAAAAVKGADTPEGAETGVQDTSRGREVLLSALVRLVERQDAPSRARSAATALIKRSGTDDVSYQDVRHMVALLDWAGRETADPLADPVRATLFRLFRELATKHGAISQDAPSIALDLSHDGFACLQVPDVVARDSSGSRTASSSSTALASLGHGPKMWPPPDGYAVSTWFRVDAFETKAERDALYRDCFISRKCVLCLRPLADERTLKCSHGGCRTCIDSLVAGGGECLVCNPPSVFLFRFRSGDGKSVSEAFLRGGKLLMRTSTGSHQATAFHHAPIVPNKWYHAVILHSRQRFQSSSVALYLNGVLQETVKVSYPSSIALGQPLGGVIGVPAQVRRRSSTRLRIGPFYLIEDALSAPVINALFAAGPTYDKLFFGATGNADVRVALDHLQLRNLAMLDEYMRDPVQALIESVDTERIAKSSLIRSGLTLASAASATAAAIVHDIKWGGSWFARIPSAAPSISIPIASEKVLLAFSPRKAVGRDPLLMPSGKLDGRLACQAMGGAAVLATPYTSAADLMFALCGSGCQLAYKLLHEATTTSELETALRVLEMMMVGHPDNLAAMEKEHGYGIVNAFLHRQAALLDHNCLRILFSIVGVDVDQDSGLDGEHQLEDGAETKSLITNMQALQHFILDFSLWGKAQRGTRKQLFVALYSTLVAVEDDGALERNRAQLQSVSFLKQLLRVLLEPSVDFDVLQVIADLILVCLTTYRGSTVEDNFAEVASFLTSTLSPSFGRSAAVLESPRSIDALDGRDRPERGVSRQSSNRWPKHDDPVASLGLSPRGALLRRRNGSLGLDTSVFEYVQQDDTAGVSGLNQDDDNAVNSTSCAARESAVAIVQNMLLDVLLRAAQKLDLKGGRDGEDGSSTSSVNETVAESSHTEGGNAHESSSMPTTGTRMQLPTTGRLTGFRKVLSPRWVFHFLFSAPWHSPGQSPTLHPTTIVRALKLFGALVKRHTYEAACRREHYYRLLAHGLPCRPDRLGPATAAAAPFPLHEAWYALLCMLLGTPVDGLPHQINFDPYYLSKDFDGNMQRNTLANPTMLVVMLTVIRRYYNDPVAIASLPRLADSRRWAAFDVPVTGDRTAGEDGEDSARHHHEAALEFVAHLYHKMSCIRGMLASSSGERFRHDLLDELSLIACAAARSRVVNSYAPTKSTVLRSLLRQKKEANAYEYTLCRATLAEEAAAASSSPGDDPFAHPVADRALKLLEAVLTDLILDCSSGSEVVEAFFDNTIAAGGGLSPPLHPGLSVRFHANILARLVDQVGRRLRGDSVLADHKAFGFNCREFLRLAVKRMQCWQRAQHGDGCPAVLSCCEAYHFCGGQFRLLNLALTVLAETSVGISGSTAATGSGSVASTSFSVMLSEKLAKGKKKRPLRTLLGRLGLPRSAELEALTSELFSTLNAVILHILNSHRVLVTDAELEETLQQLHAYREVVLGSRNSLNKDFFVCLCRGLLQLLMDSSARRLQDAAAHLWTDLMFFQRSFMTSLLTVDIRRAGASPYSVNLMKNGFNVLLERQPAKESSADGDGDAPAVVKLAKWLQVVGPPLRELENNLDSVFMKRAMELTEAIGDAWAASHKTAAHQRGKFAKRFDARLSWSHEALRSNTDALRAAQQKELRHQAKWHQNYVDRQKYSLRQLEIVERRLLRAVVDGGGERPNILSGRDPSHDLDRFEASEERRHTRLDFTEGPYRMRKRMTRYSPSDDAVEAKGEKKHDAGTHDKNEGESSGSGREDHHPMLKTPARSSSALRLHTRRRYSADDIDVFRGEKDRGLMGFSVSKNLGGAFLARQSDVCLSTRWVEAARRGPSAGAPPQPLHLFSSGDSYTSDDISLSDGAFSDGVDSMNATSGLPRGVGDNGDAVLFDKDEDVVDEKLRPLLVPGDDIEDIRDCLRIDGMDSCPGVFMLCSDRVYIVDNYQQVVQRTLPPLLASGNEPPHRQIRVTEVARGSTTRLERRLGLHNRVALTRAEPCSTGIDNPMQSGVARGEISTHQSLHWAYEDVTELHKRRYQLQHIAIELFATDGRNYLITFETREEREAVFHALLSRCPNVRGAASGLDRAAAGGGDLYSQLKKLLRNNMTERWVQGSISNFEYLMHLNTLAGRSYNDLTQYPVFPWILADYTSEELDLCDPSVYRDLSKPMGALYREEEFRARYDSLMESSLSSDSTGAGSGGSSSTATAVTSAARSSANGSATAEADDPLVTKPFHYGTHYSSAAITLHYLMRLEPFTSHFRSLHDGKFDHADRLFASIHGAWRSAAGVEGAQNGGTQDVKELIPEFFYLPAFLKNVNACDFGRDQTGANVGDIALPPWANGSPAEFVRLNREALESSVVSASLHHWIDLIFGYKQQGPAAVEACNVFYHLTYEGAVDLDAIRDTATKRAIVAQIAEFGQTPSQLFKSPHPARSRSAIAARGVGSGAIGLGSSFLSTSVNSLGSSAALSGGLVSTSMPPPSAAASGTNAVPMAAPSPLTARSLASSFLEGGELMNRMQTIISGGGGVSNGSSSDDQSLALDQAPLLQAQRLREVPVNAVVAAHRSQLAPADEFALQAQPASRRRLLSSGHYASSIHQIAMASGSVEKRVVALGPQSLFLPPRNTEFLAWGFQDSSLKVLSTASSESGHNGDSKVLVSVDVPFDISVAAVSSDGRTLITGSGNLPAMRIWRLEPHRRPAVPSLSASAVATRRRYTASSSFSPLTTRMAGSGGIGSGGGGSGSGGGLGVSLGSHSATKSLVVVATASSPAQSGAITALCVSREFSVFVSGCATGIAVLWDLNRRVEVRSLPPLDNSGSAVTTIEMNAVTGDIVMAVGERFGVYDVNGSLRVRLDYTTLFHDPKLSRAPVSSLAIERLAACEWRAEKRVVTGHEDGVLCVWAYVSAGAGGGFGSGVADEDDDEWTLELQARHVADATGSALTAVFLSADERKLWSGSCDGVLSTWAPRPADAGVGATAMALTALPPSP